MSEDLAELLEHHSFDEHVNGGLLHVGAEEIKRLQAIVDKLPKTADGVHWIPGQAMEVYHPHEAGSQDDVACDEDGGWVAWWWAVRPGECRAKGYDISDCYSTREAAEAARDDPIH